MSSRIAFQSEARRHEGTPDALVIHCSDHRFQHSFREFLAEGLKLPSYALIAMPGGGHFFTLEYVLPKYAKVGMQSVRFHLERARPHRIVLIGHDDCLFFKERVQFYYSEPDLHAKQAAGLRKARAIAEVQFPGLPVELFFADTRPDGSVQFLRIA
jgi:hypothetical protein